MYGRKEVREMSLLEMNVAADECRLNLRRAWDRGDPGKSSDLATLVYVMVEASMNGWLLRPMEREGWLRLYDPDNVDVPEVEYWRRGAYRPIRETFPVDRLFSRSD